MLIFEATLGAALIISAFLALHIDETVYSIIFFGATLTILSALFFYMDAPFAAIFQIVIAVGAIAIFFLAGEMLTPRKKAPKKGRSVFIALAIASILSVLPILSELNVEVFSRSHDLSFASVLWRLRGLDVIAQSIVILTLALGIVMVLGKRGGKKRVWST